MDLTGKTVWQQAAGDNDRDYSAICLQWGVILNGPSDRGKWPECEALLRKDGWSARKMTDLRRFSEEMKNGDIVVLRLGTRNVIAVGEISGNYDFREPFGDVDGWDIRHLRRVKWIWAASTPLIFDTYSLKQGDTSQRLDANGPIWEWLAKLDVGPAPDHPPLPPDQGDLPLRRIADFLYDRGVASDSIESLLGEMDELIRLANWYQRQNKERNATEGKEYPSEAETVSYLALPLLRALGWTPQKMAIERKNVDISLFSRLPRDDSNLQVVVEAKRKDKSCLTAISQAEQYSKGKPSVSRLIVTDGIRYGVFFRDGTTQRFEKIHAYLNISRLRESYPVYECAGAMEAIWSMTPEWKPS